MKSGEKICITLFSKLTLNKVTFNLSRLKMYVRNCLI